METRRPRFETWSSRCASHSASKGLSFQTSGPLLCLRLHEVSTDQWMVSAYAYQQCPKLFISYTVQWKCEGPLCFTLDTSIVFSTQAPQPQPWPWPWPWPAATSLEDCTFFILKAQQDFLNGLHHGVNLGTNRRHQIIFKHWKFDSPLLKKQHTGNPQTKDKFSKGRKRTGENEN